MISASKSQIASQRIHEKIGIEVSWSFASKALTALLFFLLTVYLARTLGVEKFGLWSYFLSMFTIIALISDLGINASSRKYVAQYNNTQNLSHVLRSSLKIRLTSLLLFSILFFIVHAYLAQLIRKPSMQVLFLYSIPLLFFYGTLEYLKNIFMGLHRLKYNFYLNTIEYSLKLILLIIIFFFFQSLLIIINVYLIANISAVLLGAYFLYGYLQKSEFSENSFSRSILKYSIPLFFTTIGLILGAEIDTVMLGLLSNNTQVGIYAVSKQIILKLPHISGAIAMGTMPIFARMNQANSDELKKIFFKTIKINLIVFLFISFSIVIFAPVLVPVIFGPEYRSSVLPLQLLIPYLLIFSHSIFLSSLLDYQGLAWKRAINLSIGIFSNIGLNLLLIPRYGATGAAIATSVSYIPYFLLNLFEVFNIFKQLNSQEIDAII